MTKQNLMIILGLIVLIILIVGFIGSTWNPSNIDATNNTTTPDANPTNTQATITPLATSSATISPTSTSTTPTPTITGSNTDTSSSTDNSNYASYIATSTASTTTVAQELSSNQKDHEGTQDYTWSSSDVITITLNGNAISTSNTECVTISGTTATVTAAGTYSISGTLDNGQITVNAPDKAIVQLILNGATITSTTDAPIYIVNAKKAIIILAADTTNSLTDTAANQNKGTIFSKADLTICGDGTLTVIGNSNDAIRSSDGLIIKNGTIKVTSVDDGIIGKDYIIVKGGTITINTVGDGLKSDNDENATRGYIYITTGTITVTATKGDAISAKTDLLITGGNITVTSGGGSQVTPNTSLSTKGLKGSVSVIIDNGDFTIKSSDDAIHSNDTIVINNGNYDIATGDDAVHADTTLEINGGAFVISKCYEGIESANLTINNGYIQINSTDDGLNAAGGNDGSSTDWFPGQRGGGMPGQGGAIAIGNYHLTITGGYIYIDAYGDGIDINGYIEMSGGILIINGPTANMNGAIDYDRTFNLTGGTIVAVGSSGMAMSPSATSTINSVRVNFNTVQSAGNLISIQTTSGNVLLTFSPSKTYQSITYSAPELIAGTYNLYLGGTSTGSRAHGIYEDGSYSEGNKYTSFTISGVITNIR